MDSLQLEVSQVKELVQNSETSEKSSKQIPMDSFRRLQDKVKDHGDLLSKLKNGEGWVY